MAKWVGRISGGEEELSEAFTAARKCWEWLARNREEEERRFSGSMNVDDIKYTDIAYRLRSIADSKDGFTDWDGVKWDVNGAGTVVDEVSGVEYSVETA